jgi:hypothetical protein
MAHNPGPLVPTFGTVPMIHARCTLVWHLPTCIARCTMKSDSRRHPQATRRQRGRAVTRRVTGKTACHLRLAQGDRSRLSDDLAT